MRSTSRAGRSPVYTWEFEARLRRATLPAPFAGYDGDHVKLTRIALTVEQLEGLPSFPAADKKKDPRYKWFVANHGRHCWELDAMDPNDLRDCVEQAIVGLIEPVAWQRCEVVNKAEQELLQTADLQQHRLVTRLHRVPELDRRLVQLGGERRIIEPVRRGRNAGQRLRRSSACWTSPMRRPVEHGQHGKASNLISSTATFRRSRMAADGCGRGCRAA